MSEAAVSSEAADVEFDVPPLSDKVHAVADRLVRRYPVARSALLPLLHLVQSEQNHITEDGIAFCAEKLGLTKAEVGAVATFYTMYKREPVGDYLLSVCCNPTCQLAGGQVILDRYKAALGGRMRDPDTKVMIEEAECLGICDAAPVVQVNYEMYGPLTDGEADALLAGCRKGDPPPSNWSNEKPPTFAEVEFELAGGNDDFDEHLIAAARHAITAYDEVPAYKSGETDIPVTHPGGDPMGQGGELLAQEQLAAGAGTARPAPSAAPEPAPDEQADTSEQPEGVPSGEEQQEAAAVDAAVDGSGAEADETAGAPGAGVDESSSTQEGDA